MNFGQNLQFLRKMHNGMTQEELAEKMNVSRQTVSKWEVGSAYPEMDKAFELCEFFSCSMDQLLREDINSINESYSNIRIEEVKPFRYVSYSVISPDPEGDAINHMEQWAAQCGIKNPEIIGWDFPFVSQEQINVYHMHGYAAACILPNNEEVSINGDNVIYQNSQKYAVITIKDPFNNPFNTIPNAYKTLMAYMQINKMKHKESKEVLSCFEKEYVKDKISYMDVYIAADI